MVGPEAKSNLVETLGAAHCNTVEYLVALGRFDEARAQAKAALSFARKARVPVFIAISLQHLALIALRSRIEGLRTTAHYRGAARLLGFVGSRCDTLGFERVDLRYDNDIALLRETIGADEVTHLMADGATMTEDEASEQAHALE
jgi:hypothetical protein